MNFLSRILILVLCLILAALLTIPFALDNSSLKFQIEQKISKKLNTNFEIKGDVDIAFLPLPKIIIHKANLNNFNYGEQVINMRLDSVTVRPQLFALLKRKIVIDKIIFSAPQIELNDNEKTAAEEQKPEALANAVPKPPAQTKFSDRFFNIKSVNEDTLDFKNIENIKVVKGTFLKHDADDKIALEFSKIEFVLKNDLQDHIFTIKGNFFSGDLPTAFKIIINTNKDKNSSLSIDSPILRIDLSGKFDNSQIDHLSTANFSGKFDAEIISLKSVLNKYFSKNSLAYNRVNNTQPIKISSDIEGIKGEMKARNIVINSQLVSGTGQIDANFANARPIIDANITLNNIDIDSIWLNGTSNKDEGNVKSQHLIINNFLNRQDNNNPEKTKLLANKKPTTSDDQLDDEGIDLTADINIKSAKYLEGEIKDVNLYFIAGGGKMLLQPLLMRVPGNGIVRIIGSFENEDNIPKFIGKIDSSGKNLQQFLSWFKIEPQNLKPNSLSDYSIISDILLLPHFMVLSNLYAGINNNKNLVSGYIQFDNSSNTPIVNSDFRVNEINIEDYFLVSDKNQYLSNGSLLNKLLWLNSNTSNTSLSLFFGKLSYRQNVFYNQPLKVEFGQGYFRLNDFQLKSNDINIAGSLNVNIANNNPVIDINLKSENFRFTTPELATNSDNKNKDFKSSFLKQFFNLPSFDNFNGSVNINITNLMIDNLGINNVKIAGKIKDGELNLNDANLDLYEGNLKYNGKIIFKSSKALSGSFTLTNIDNSTFLKDVFGVKNVSGISNITGVVSVVGKDREEFYKNLDLDLKFISGNVTLKGFGIDDLLRKMLSPYQYKAELGNPNAILFNPANKSYFKDVSGKFTIGRGDSEDKVRVETSSVGINSVTTGKIDLANNIFEGTSNFIFLTGSKQRQIPINIAINYKGQFGNISSTANVEQVNQYLNSLN